jgi:hypothetical protein
LTRSCFRFTDPEVLKNVTVHAGTNFLNETGYAYAVEKVIIHANFNILLIRNDIGLLRLKTDIAYNKVVQAIPVANTDSIAAGESCFLTGWGRLKVRNDDPKRSCHLTYEVMRSRDALTWNSKNPHILPLAIFLLELYLMILSLSVHLNSSIISFSFGEKYRINSKRSIWKSIHKRNADFYSGMYGTATFAHSRDMVREHATWVWTINLDETIIRNIKRINLLNCSIMQTIIGWNCWNKIFNQRFFQGDSGSPLVANDVQIGLASFVRPCAVGYPDVYTRVSAFKDWIAQHVTER